MTDKPIIERIGHIAAMLMLADRDTWAAEKLSGVIADVRHLEAWNHGLRNEITRLRAREALLERAMEILVEDHGEAWWLEEAIARSEYKAAEEAEVQDD